jgi:hypothetical protein
MTKVKVIRNLDLPTKAPLSLTISIWLLLDRLQVSPVWMGVYYTIFTVIWISIITSFVMQESVPVKFEEK